MKLAHVQKRMHEARIKCFCLQADTLLFILMFLYADIHITKYYIYKLINRDIVVYLKYDVKFT